jgi:hypothetical protein
MYFPLTTYRLLTRALLSFHGHSLISYQIVQHYAINYHESTYNLTANDNAEIDTIILCGQQFLHNYSK